MFPYLMSNYLRSWLFPFFFTVATETVIVWIFLRKVFRISADDLPLKLVIGASIFANGFTHPQVWFVFPFVFQTYAVYLTVSELFAFLAEALFYWLFLKISAKRALVVSFAANGFSFLAGAYLHFFVNNKFF